MKVARNQPCPCGSGEKYKACCGKGKKNLTGARTGRLLALIVGIVVIGGVAIAINQFARGDLGPQPYSYDAANDRYWDPVHSHWHDGRPPQNAAEEGQAGSNPNPQPWEYDAAKNQHYDPEHSHWHAGPPPAQAGNLLPGGLPSIPAAGDPVPLDAPAAAPVAAAPVEGDPAPWDYDAENDEHWNPNTRTWDAGMPPLEAFTSDGE